MKLSKSLPAPPGICRKAGTAPSGVSTFTLARGLAGAGALTLGSGLEVIEKVGRAAGRILLGPV